MRRWHRFFVFLGAVSALLGSNVSQAGRNVTWTLNPSASSISVSGAVEGYPLEQQAAGSMTTTYSGPMNTVVSGPFHTAALPNALQFSSASVDAAVNGTWQPGIGGVSGSAPGDYGVKANMGLFGTLYAAMRDFMLNLTSSQLAVSGGGFNSSLIDATVLQGYADYRSILGSARDDLAGEIVANSATAGLIALNGTTATLTVPVDATLPISGGFTGTIRLQGTLVGTTAVLVAGDTNGDGDVDLADLGSLAGAYGTPSGAVWSSGDFDDDGDVDLVDLGALAGNYGIGTPAPLNFAGDLANYDLVPEPATLLVIVIGGWLAPSRKK